MISKPGSVPLARWRSSVWADGCPAALATQPGRFSGPLHPFPIRSCSGWGLPSRPVTRPLVRSYRTVASLPARRPAVFISVALALRSPSLDVIQHPALWSPDFPRPPRVRPRSPFLLTAKICRHCNPGFVVRGYRIPQPPLLVKPGSSNPSSC